MRIIKYRAKDENGKWVYGSIIIHYYDRICDSIVYAEIEGSDIYNVGKRCYESTIVNYDTIGQFTGFKDANGKEIYEGDIVRWKADNRLYAVTFNWGMFYASVEACNEEIYGGFTLHTLATRNGKGVEIVGNIYDNPELIQK